MILSMALFIFCKSGIFIGSLDYYLDMEIAAVLNVHSQPDVIRDTIDSILTYLTEKIIVVVDGAAWPSLKYEKFPVGKMEGFYHNIHKSPYRNVALSLKTVTETYPDAQWYCYTEYDVLFASERIKNNLRLAEEKGVWMLGNDGRVDVEAMPLIQSLVGEKFKSSYYLLGCCQFFHRNFISKLNEIDFFNRFLNLTNGFTDGFFPFYGGYDLSEHMYPTLCRHFGGNIGVFAHYDENGRWHGAYKHFPVRWRPEIDPETENFPEASIIHPLKTYDHPIREMHRERRNKWKDLKKKGNLLESSSMCLSDTLETAGASLMS